MKITVVYLALLIPIFVACKQNKTNTSAAIETQSDKEKIDSFFPVTSFLKGQLAILDSLPVTPLRTIVVNDKTDSAWVKREELHSLLQPFFFTEIKETNLTDLFRETSFKDQSLNAITFTYDPKKRLPDSLLLTHWDVYINPEPGTINKIYMVKKGVENNKNYIQQLTWETDKWAKIVTIFTDEKEKPLSIKEDKISWSF
ncbi:MAG: hypothetical protein V4556_06845 [Bacteroidota bacterium]